jgi:hypothetical protein
MQQTLQLLAATPLVLLLQVYALWGLYLLVMGLYRAKLDGRLTRTSMILGAPYLALGYVCDFVANMTVATIVFLEWPREVLVTSRLTRHLKSGGPSWRHHIAHWVCKKLLDPFDPKGEHCR